MRIWVKDIHFSYIVFFVFFLLLQLWKSGFATYTALMLFITSLALQQMPPDETHPGTKYIIQGRRGLARLLTKTTDQEAGL